MRKTKHIIKKKKNKYTKKNIISGGSTLFDNKLLNLLQNKGNYNNLYVKLHGSHQDFNNISLDKLHTIVPNNLYVIHFFYEQHLGISNFDDEIEIRNNLCSTDWIFPTEIHSARTNRNSLRSYTHLYLPGDPIYNQLMAWELDPNPQQLQNFIFFDLYELDCYYNGSSYQTNDRLFEQVKNNTGWYYLPDIEPQKDNRETLRNEADEIFDNANLDDDGNLSFTEIKNLLRNHDILLFHLFGIDLNTRPHWSHIKSIIEQYKIGGNMSRETWIQFYIKQRNIMRKNMEIKANQIFDEIDINNDDTVLSSQIISYLRNIEKIFINEFNDIKINYEWGKIKSIINDLDTYEDFKISRKNWIDMYSQLKIIKNPGGDNISQLFSSYIDKTNYNSLEPEITLEELLKYISNKTPSDESRIVFIYNCDPFPDMDLPIKTFRTISHKRTELEQLGIQNWNNFLHTIDRITTRSQKPLIDISNTTELTPFDKKMFCPDCDDHEIDPESTDAYNSYRDMKEKRNTLLGRGKTLKKKYFK